MSINNLVIVILKHIRVFKPPLFIYLFQLFHILLFINSFYLLFGFPNYYILIITKSLPSK